MWPEASTRHRFDPLCWTAELALLCVLQVVKYARQTLHCTFRRVSDNSVSVPWHMQKPSTMGVTFHAHLKYVNACMQLTAGMMSYIIGPKICLRPKHDSKQRQLTRFHKSSRLAVGSLLALQSL